MTHSTPPSLCPLPREYMVGMPPPPAAITMALRSSSHLIGRSSKMRFGSGEATTRRQSLPSGLKTHDFSAESSAASSLV